ncbi:MAG: ATP-binding protein [Acetanaerobacterium sp.]
MQKSLFTKYFTLLTSIILGSMAILGAVLLFFAAQYFKFDRERLLLRNAHGAASITASEYVQRADNSIRRTVVLASFEILGGSVDATIFLTDNNGNTLVATQALDDLSEGTVIAPAILQKAVESGSFSELGRLGGLFYSNYYTVGVPVLVDGVGKIGFVFVSSSAVALNYFLVEMLRMFTLSAMLVLMFSFVVIYIATRRMTRPLREMALAARSFGKGDFTRRVPVRDNDEMGQLAVAFNNMASSLATTEKMRRSFVANVSHELKTPMTTIGGFIEGILDGTIPEEKREHYMRIVADETRRLSRLVRSMLDLSKIEAGEMTINPVEFDLNETVCRAIFTFEQRIDKKKLDIRGLDVGKVMVYADPDMLHQVAYNLIDNAVKFVDTNGYIEVSYKTEGSFTYVGVRNSGEGIPREEVQNVFDRFYKTDKSRSLDKQGVGLGLYIVKTIVNLHHGDIIVNSEPGQFCEFVFSVPTAPAPPRAGLSLREKKKQREEKDGDTDTAAGE